MIDPTREARRKIRIAKAKYLALVGEDWTPIQQVRATVLTLGIWWLVTAGEVEVRTLGVGITLVRRMAEGRGIAA